MVQLDEELSEVLRTRWGIKEPTVASSHQSSLSRIVFRLSTPSRDYAVKIDSQPHTSVIGGITVQQHVAVLAPGLAPPVPTAEGQLSATARGRQITVSEWISGTPPADERSTWTRIGEAAATIHGLPLVARDFAIPLDLACQELERQPHWPVALVSAVVDRVQHLDGGPVTVVHGQLNPANVIQRADRGLTVLDWDEAGTGMPAIDLGYPLLCVFLSEDLTWHHDQAAAFYRGYRQTNTTPLPPVDDILTLGLLLGLRSAMFANQTARWNRVRHALANEPEMRRAIGCDRKTVG